VLDLTRNKKVLALRAEIEDEGMALAGWVDKTKVHLSLALGFM
jgi:hypothetical protein